MHIHSPWLLGHVTREGAVLLTLTGAKQAGMRNSAAGPFIWSFSVTFLSFCLHCYFSITAILELYLHLLLRANRLSVPVCSHSPPTRHATDSPYCSGIAPGPSGNSVPLRMKGTLDCGSPGVSTRFVHIPAPPFPASKALWGSSPTPLLKYPGYLLH